MKHDKAYLITYEAEAGKYEQFLPVVEKMIKSLEVARQRNKFIEAVVGLW